MIISYDDSAGYYFECDNKTSNYLFELSQNEIEKLVKRIYDKYPFITKLNYKYLRLGTGNFRIDYSLCHEYFASQQAPIEQFTKSLQQLIADYLDIPKLTNSNKCTYISHNGIYSPQSFIMAATGECYIINDDSFNQINMLIKKHNITNSKGRLIKSYNFEDIANIVKDQTRVILVDVTDPNESGESIQNFKWFECPKRIEG